MIRSMEEEFHRIVGVSVPLWGFVVAFMLLNVEGSNLYFWISVVPITLVLLVGAKLQHVIAILTLETAGLTEHSEVGKLKPRDDLFWFKKPELFLPLIHFILFQNSFELASFFWFWWQFGYKSCFIRSHFLVYIRLVLGFAGQFLCSYSTLPLYALVTQMGTKYKAALIPQIIRETLLGLGKAARRKTKDGIFTDDPTMHTDTRTVMVEEENHHLLDIPENDAVPATQIEFQPASFIPASPTTVANETSCRAATRFLRPSASVPSSERSYFHVEDMPRSSSMPVRKL
ncbi:MLO-LIKE PROTEIN 1 [Salix viminalis]|uniref:MLO-LIKE PROTEIN 1 n=1 Tax=Salix viminalis TaxID=40686 RepID=A0A9Q0U6T4_SALVM|nr:MLO-LIKE PROTEIN 1 [Salix viminalis]